MTPQARRLVDALGGDVRVALAILRTTADNTDGETFEQHADRVRQAAFDATYKVAEGHFVTYHDAKAWTEQALRNIYVDRQHPYLRLVMRNSTTASGYRTTQPIAVPGATALDLLNHEGSALSAVQRVIVGKPSPSKGR